ncbi:uncharacterized protein LOC142317506 [Lycorma delicatula]|uniref:uncharacterized protein LOC142317506 n=1 Tax=Lycorma delicatula TaxID=130591 RepID=UPI003F50E72A
MLRVGTLRSRRGVQSGVRSAGATGGVSPNGTTRPGTSSVASVVAEVQSPSAVESRGRKRFKWTDEHNAFLYRTYLTTTKMESDMKPYSVPLHQAMVEKFPELRCKSVQNILDQRRYLFKSNRVPADVVALIRADVSRELGLFSSPSSDESAVKEAIRADNPLSDQFAENEMLYGGMGPSARQRIPRVRVNRSTRKLVGLSNEILEEKVRLVPSIIELHELLVYIGAITAVKENGQRIVAPAMRKSPQRPPWEERLCRKVDKLRKEIGRLSSFLTSANPSGRIRSAAESIIRTYENPENTTGHDVLDLLKQQLMVLSCRLRRYR